MSLEKKYLFGKLKFLWVLAVIFSFVVFVRLFHIQIINHKHYLEEAESNRTHVIYKVAPRGRIFTEDNVIIASNGPTFSLYYLPNARKNIKYLNELAEDISKKINKNKDEIFASLKKANDTKRAVLLGDNLSPKSIYTYAELKDAIPNIEFIENTKRFYPFDNMASHLIGFIGVIDKKDWQDQYIKSNYRYDNKIGQSGIEKRFEKYLKGRDGGVFLEIDSKGRVKNIMQSRSWRPGADVHLTLNHKLQQVAEEGLKKSISGLGAVVVMNPQNGKILAIASAPSYDLNKFVSYYDENPSGYVNTGIMEYNLAVKGLYPPASVFKILVSIAALENNIINKEDEVLCKGSLWLGNREFGCWKTHGKTNFWDALKHSCDVYFYTLAQKMGAFLIEKYQNKFHLSEPTYIDMEGEKASYTFGPKERFDRKGYWYAGDNLNMCIGQGELLITPIKMAQFISAVANGGKLWKPYYVDKIVSQNGKTLFAEKEKLLGDAKIKPETKQIMDKALKNVVDAGTGWAVNMRGVDVMGKTGTAQNPHGEDHGWFVAYANLPDEEPEIVVVVFVQHGKSGSSGAGPVARKILNEYFKDRV
ncbi:MAG: penicillin-binding protein 2 [Elusimicrobiaceae bacterium]|jgi:penicillin-binding protein 2|nr:penicillin-binding protein 2 [Elusimicrobiaceae bacterium]MBT4007775.1 penicillin-binding protein 2 [Elusimicrobiaceae bacterium]MBT4402421.1 penicillin-binding protein 2 [Elusimicrobiaceae bacterium]MBT4440416.1 penicillin-binding protein 2 [Elusimicrobiaceae bacterium]MBT7283091.1 penicillin-binding protein 2 [Elusimicrobiaceae bacterium]